MEWKYPENYSLSGVEFKALPSGAHNVQHDIMLFELNSHFGIAAYIMKQVNCFARNVHLLLTNMMVVLLYYVVTGTIRDIKSKRYQNSNAFLLFDSICLLQSTMKIKYNFDTWLRF